MGKREGFTLIEIIVVLIIVGITAAFVVPSLVSSIEQTNAQVAKNNLLAISAAQSKFNEDYTATCTSAGIATCYCIDSAGQNPLTLTNNCGDKYADLNANLYLNISSNDPFSYSCAGPSASCAGLYCCSANDTKVTLNLVYTTAAGAVVTCSAGGSYCPN